MRRAETLESRAPEAHRRANGERHGEADTGSGRWQDSQDEADDDEDEDENAKKSATELLEGARKEN